VHNAQKIMRKLSLLLILVSLLAACGLKGPLYIPTQKPAAAPPPVPDVSNTQTDDKKIPGPK
jgi:predicted small lipoprotein YifL